MKPIEFGDALTEARKRATQANENLIAAKKAWHESNYASGKPFADFKQADKENTLAKREVKRLEILTGDNAIYANQYFYTDIEPWEVIEIKTDRCLVVREMKAFIKVEAKKALQDSFVPGGFCGHFENDLQDWTYESDPNGQVAEIRLHKDGFYYLPGYSGKGTRFKLSNVPTKYYDYNF